MSNWSSQAYVNQTMDSVPHLGCEWEPIEVLWKEQNFCPQLYLKRARIVYQVKFEFSNYEFPYQTRYLDRYQNLISSFSHATLIDRFKFYINRALCIAVILITHRYANRCTDTKTYRQTKSEKKYTDEKSRRVIIAYKVVACTKNDSWEVRDTSAFWHLYV